MAETQGGSSHKAKVSHTEPRSWTVSTSCGAVSGIIPSLLFFPLDTIRTRLIIQYDRRHMTHVDVFTSSKHHNMIGATQALYRQGGPRAFYRGITPTLWGLGIHWALQFTCYERLKKLLHDSFPNQSVATMNVISAATSGFISSTVTGPIWVVKTRLQTWDHILHHRERRTVVGGLRELWREGQIRALYKGYIPSLLGLAHVAIQLPLYDSLKTFLRDQKTGEDKELTRVDWVLASVVSKTIASTAAYPHEVLRIRLQDQHSQAKGSYPNIMHALKEILATEGVRGLYKGCLANLMRVVPHAALTFLTFEECKRRFDNQC